MRTYFGIHNHTYYSNIRLLDSINKPKDLIDTAIKLGMSGVAITDHECLSAHMEVNQYAEEIKKEHPDFKIALGNEIYLVNDRERNQKYYHFLLIAKDAIGHKALRELSSIAWQNLYVDKKMERVPTTKNELKEIVNKYPGHLIATTACIGGELSSDALMYAKAEIAEDLNLAVIYKQKIIDFIMYCKELFGEDFYIECAPSTNGDQRLVNSKLYSIAKCFDIKMVVGTDAHYLTKNDRLIHKAYLNSKEGDREVDAFYEFTYLMDSEEVDELLKPCFPDGVVDWILDNTLEVQNKIEDYSLERKQIIPKVDLPDYSEWDIYKYIKQVDWKFSANTWPTLKWLCEEGNIQERYWLYECLKSLHDKGFQNKLDYWDRLEIEADIIKYIGEKLDDCLFAYFNTFKHYIDLFWKCGSIVGPGRGSATGFLSNYLLGITQLDPIRWKLNYWRFLNKERAELPDIDIDLAPSKRPAIFEAIRKERGALGLIQVATFGTEGTKSAVLTACRGYRSDDYPDGIDVDQAQYMSSLIPQERGFLWPIKDVIHGNEEKDRAPVHAFIREVNQYPGLLDIIERIEGIVNKRSSHASGVILYGIDPFETASFMKTPGGDLITCYDLHKAEAAGDTKYDFLVTEVSDKIIKCIDLLQEDEVIEKDTLRNIYNKYLHPEVMDTTNPVIWEHLEAGDVLDVFQFNEGSGLAVAKKCKPKNMFEMTAANAMMRLMSEKGKESQQDRYVRIKDGGIKIFDKEMRSLDLTEDFITKMHNHCDIYYGCCPIQEQMMEILMDIAGFSLGDAGFARKVVAKKQMDKIPTLQNMLYEKITNKTQADYLWDTAVRPQLGYAFSINHSLPYSFVGVQTIYLATHFNSIYWNTACLTVNSGAMDEDNGGSTDYGKIAKALGDIINENIKVGLVDINKSAYGFKPDIENNQILFGLKGMLNVGDDIIAATIERRPYVSPRDYINKVNPNKQAMISLIKGGAFDNLMDRKICMAWYIWNTCNKKSKITLQNMGGLIKYNLIPDDLILERRIFEFNRYLKKLGKFYDYYKLDERAINFLVEIERDYLIKENEYIKIAEWEKIYSIYMDKVRAWIIKEQDKILNDLNILIFKEDWDKYALGNYSSWEMEALCFYYHDHELIDVDNTKYGFSNFKDLPYDPEVDQIYHRRGADIKLFKLAKICGTCIAKNKTKSLVTLLTTDGVVNVKFRKEYFAMFDKQISGYDDNGEKHTIEKSWFNRGSMIVLTGMRSGDDFIVKRYATTPGHQLYKIDELLPNGQLRLRHERYQGEVEDD